MTTFTWVPDFSPDRQTKPRVRVIKFGDGYEQRSLDGINTLNRTWSLTFSARTDSEANSIEAFLEARNGIEAFDWTPPAGSAAKWICREWSRRMDRYNLNTVTASFERVFES